MSDSDSYSHLVSLPAAHGADDAKTWPLLLFLHGAGERGSDVWSVARQGVPRLLAGSSGVTATEEAVATRLGAEFIVVAPQCPQFEVWHEQRLLALLDSAARRFRVDERRVHVTGLSLGGFGTWTLGLRHPARFATLAPVCGGGRIADVLAAVDREPEILRTLGIWAFHGARDRVVPLDESERMIRALQAAGARDVRLTVYPEAEHDAWTAAYADPAFYDWLAAHRR